MKDREIPFAKSKRSALNLSGYRKITYKIVPIMNPLDTKVEIIGCLQIPNHLNSNL